MSKNKIFKVLTYNIFAGKFSLDPKRIAAQIEAIKKLDCDILCFQEAWDRDTIETYRKAFVDYDIVTCNSNFNSDEHATLLLSRGGFCQRLCELVLPSIAFLICIFLLIYYFIFYSFTPKIYLIFVFVIALLVSIIISVFSNTFIRWIWHCCKLPQNGFITGDILGLMILIRNGENKNGVIIKYVAHSSFAEVFTRQAAKKIWRIFGCVERFFIIKGYLSIDVHIGELTVAVTNIHLNTGTKNKARMAQVKELFRKAIPQNKATILCGDTNAEPEQPEIMWVSSRMVDTYKKCRRKDIRRESRGDGFTWHTDNTLTHQGFLQDPNMRIDYIWFKNNKMGPNDNEEKSMSDCEDSDTIKVYDSKIVLDHKPFHSDHFGVCTEFEIK